MSRKSIVVAFMSSAILGASMVAAPAHATSVGGGASAQEESDVPPVSAEMKAFFEQSHKYMVFGIREKQITGTGNQPFFPRTSNPPPVAPKDAVLVNVTWNVATSGSGTGYCVATAPAGSTSAVRAVGTQGASGEFTQQILSGKCESDVQPPPPDPNAPSPEMTRFLGGSAEYMIGGINAGQVKGAGDQETFPKVENRQTPTGAKLLRVAWNVTAPSDTSAGQAKFCVTAADSQTGSVFHVRAERAMDGRFAMRNVAGKCEWGGDTPPPPDPTKPSAEMSRFLSYSAEYMMVGMKTNQVREAGDQETWPAVADRTPPTGAKLVRVAWWNLSTPERVQEAQFCVTAAENSSGSLFHVKKKRASDGRWLDSVVAAGECKLDTPPTPSDPTAPSPETVTFLDKSADYMSKGILSGYIRGAGDQERFPMAENGTPPTEGARLVRVAWSVPGDPDTPGVPGTSSTEDAARFCVTVADNKSGKMFHTVAEQNSDGRFEVKDGAGMCEWEDDTTPPKPDVPKIEGDYSPVADRWLESKVDRTVTQEAVKEFLTTRKEAQVLLKEVLAEAGNDPEEREIAFIEFDLTMRDAIAVFDAATLPEGQLEPVTDYRDDALDAKEAFKEAEAEAKKSARIARDKARAEYREARKAATTPEEKRAALNAYKDALKKVGTDLKAALKNAEADMKDSVEAAREVLELEISLL